MSISAYKIAEQCRVITDKRAPIQVLIPAVIQAIGVVAKKNWYELTAFDEQYVDGSFINTFNSIQPELDCDRDMYYITIPSTYLLLPHQIGIKWVSLMKDKQSFINVANWGIFNGIKASVMGGKQIYEIEGTRMWFPKMKSETSGPLLLKLAVAYDTIDPYDELNIAPNVVKDVIDVVCAPYLNTKQNPIEKIREIIN